MSPQQVCWNMGARAPMLHLTCLLILVGWAWGENKLKCNNKCNGLSFAKHLHEDSALCSSAQQSLEYFTQR